MFGVTRPEKNSKKISVIGEKVKQVLDLENKTSEIGSDKKPRLESINDYFSKLAEAEEN